MLLIRSWDGVCGPQLCSGGYKEVMLMNCDDCLHWSLLWLSWIYVLTFSRA